MPSDYTLWKMWWYAALYGASPATRMAALDRYRNSTKDLK